MNPATTGIIINVSATQVWRAITDPQLVKQYFYGTNIISDWKKGGSIIYKGEWEGKPYEDKGEILDIEPNKLLRSTFFSSLSGQEDVAENYQIVTYALTETDGKTTLTVTQENNKDQAASDGAVENWNTVLQGMKTLLEQR